MSGSAGPSIHASAVLVGSRAVLIRGPAGSGKSRLSFALLEASRTAQLAFARLVADDRTMLEVAHGRLLARPVSNLAGLLEIRGLGVRRLPYEPVAVVSHVVDLAVADAPRLPEHADCEAVVCGIMLPRIAVSSTADPLTPVLATLVTASAD